MMELPADLTETEREVLDVLYIGPRTLRGLVGALPPSEDPEKYAALAVLSLIGRGLAEVHPDYPDRWRLVR